MITKKDVEDFAKSVDDPKQAEEGMVYQVWQDGEVTLQKGGSLLWQRTLHLDRPAFLGAKDLKLEFPHKMGENSFAWVTPENATAVRAKIKELVEFYLELIP